MESLAGFLGALIGGLIGAAILGRFMAKQVTERSGFAPSCYPSNRPINIILDEQNEEIEIRPPSAGIGKGGEVTWHFGGPKGQEVLIEFDDKNGTKGPFREPKFTGTTGGKPVSSGPERVFDYTKPETAAWKYKVTWVEKSKTEDPMIIIGQN